MADISNDPAKFTPRLRSPKYTQPLNSRTPMDGDSEDEAEHSSPWKDTDKVSLGEAPQAQASESEGEDISQAELAALVKQLKEMEDDPSRVDEVLARLDEEGYDPGEVLPTLIDRMMEEDFGF